MAIFRYINMPKLVAHYLKEFSMRADGQTPSTLYKFVWCLCLPFLSGSFRRARLIALACAECTDSKQQIISIVEAITGANMFEVPLGEEMYAGFSDSSDNPMISYDGSTNPNPAVNNNQPRIVYNLAPNIVEFFIQLNGANKEDVERYLALLSPFYVNISIIYQE